MEKSNIIVSILEKEYGNKIKFNKISNDNIQCRIGERFFFNITLDNESLSISTYCNDKLCLSYLEPLFSGIVNEKPSLFYTMHALNKDLYDYVVLSWTNDIKSFVESILVDSINNKQFQPSNVHVINGVDNLYDVMNSFNNNNLENHKIF